MLVLPYLFWGCESNTWGLFLDHTWSQVYNIFNQLIASLCLILSLFCKEDEFGLHSGGGGGRGGVTYTILTSNCDASHATK